jgi:hypothetical protein
MCGTNETPIYIVVKVISQKPKQVERGNLPTCPDANFLLIPTLEKIIDTLVANMYFTLVNDF